MVRMRKIIEAMKHVRAIDLETAHTETETTLRRMIVTGALPYVRVGVKYLIDLEAPDAFPSGVLSA